MIHEYSKKYPNFFLTQTSVKDLEKDETCPDRWRAQWLTGEIKFPSNEDMDKGKYFEYLCLGGGATTDEVIDLPRLYGGKKSIDQIRIEEQVAVFKRFFNPEDPDFQGFKIIETQIELKFEGRKGTIDFLTQDADGNIWINDLKLTKDADSTRSKYGWGNPWEELDWLQMEHYSSLYLAQRGIKPRVGMWIFDYSPLKRIKFGEVELSERSFEAKDIRFNAAGTTIDLYEAHGWTKDPSEQECRNCPLSCDKRFKTSVLQKLKISI